MRPRAILIVASILYFAASNLALPQSALTPQEFDARLRSCAAVHSIGLDPKLIGSVSSLYSGENSRRIFQNPTELYALLPESSRIDAYRLYADCIRTIVPASETTPPANATENQSVQQTRPPVVTTYLVCTGEYERACLNHQVYLYCGADVNQWAQARCSSHSIVTLNTYGGNKCGYSLQQVICTNPH